MELVCVGRVCDNCDKQSLAIFDGKMVEFE